MSGQTATGPSPAGSAGPKRASWWSRPKPVKLPLRRLTLVRILVAGTLLLGLNYLTWRWLYSVNWVTWPLGLALILAETYSYLDAFLFGMTMWRTKVRPPPDLAPVGVTVDVMITCYNEPVELVRETARAALAIRYPHRTLVLDDGNSAAMQAMVEEEGAGYIVRTADWRGQPRHAKAGNLSNAMMQTNGEFLLILDADMIPEPAILDRTLGYFRDPKVALVQTPQWFYNLPPGDPFGSDAPLFYGPIQQGKDGWNAAFFCGSNAVLRREALMQLGITRYARDLEVRVRRTLQVADGLLKSASRQLDETADPRIRHGLAVLRETVCQARAALVRGVPLQDLTWDFQRQVDDIARSLVSDDLARIAAELAEMPGLDLTELPATFAAVLDDPIRRLSLTGRSESPLIALATVRELVRGLDVDRADEAQPVIPMSTISVTEDMSTAMRLHALGWHSVYHHERLARGLAPEDLGAALQQRLRWAQGTIQVMFRENPLVIQGLSIGQRAMYLATMWSYLSGFFSVAYLTMPIFYLFFGLTPVSAYSSDFFWRLLPFLVVNQLLLIVVGWGLATWRGQQYSLALFPLWIQAMTSVVQNVYFGKKLGFVVTPKTRKSGIYLRLVRPQLVILALLVAAIAFGLLKMVIGTASSDFLTAINVFWATYDVIMLSVVIEAATYHPRS